MATEDIRRDLLKTSKQSMEEVLGWKEFIFLSQHFGWRFFICATAVIIFMLNTTQVFYQTRLTSLEVLSLFCYFSYAVDTFCATLHLAMPRTRKLKHGSPRHPILLLVDYLALIPFRLIFDYLIYTDWDQSVYYSYLDLNVCLRMYQVMATFADVKVWVFKVKTYFILISFELLVVVLVMNHVFSCILFCTFDEKLQNKCRLDLLRCVVDTELDTFCFLSQAVIEPIGVYNEPDSAWALMATFLVGFFLKYGFIIPMLLFATIKSLKGFFDFSDQWNQLKQLADNTLEDKNLRQRVVDFYSRGWENGGHEAPAIVDLFPLCFRKDIFSDIYWEALRHSDFFQDISFGCKRSLSLRMSTEFLPPKTNLLKVGEQKSLFIYLVSGSLDVMAEENSNCPVVTFSGGTVLREATLLLQTKSKAIMSTGKFSVIHIIHYRDLFRVLVNYPRDKKVIFSRLRLRMELARAAQRRKKDIFPQFVATLYTDKGVQTANIKWLKQQFRAMVDVNNSAVLLKKHSAEGAAEHQRRIQNLCNDFEKTSAYISLLSIGSEIMSMYEAVCLKMSFPWAVDPQSHFLWVWNLLITFVTFYCAMVYPLFLAWWTILPPWFLNLTIVATFLFMMDVVVQLMTAVKTKAGISTNFWMILTNLLGSAWFYFDLLAAFPTQLVLLYPKGGISLGVHPYMFMTLLKTYKLFVALNNWAYRPHSGALVRVFVKDLYIIWLVVYWMAALLNLAGIKCIFYECGDNDWYPNYEKTHGHGLSYLVPAVVSTYMALGMKTLRLKTNVSASFGILLLVFLVFYALSLMFLVEVVSVNFFENSHVLEYRKLIKFASDLMVSRKISDRLQVRVLDTLEFLWKFHRGSYFIQKPRILNLFYGDLCEEFERAFILPTLRKCPLFASEDDAFQLHMSGKAKWLTLPANSVLIKFGVLSMCVYIVRKGYAEVHSFLHKDATQSVGSVVVVQEGDCFSIEASLKQMPSVVTVRTVTDCQLFMIELEDILGVMIIQGMLKDLVEALKEINFRAMYEAKPGLTVVPNVFTIKDEEYRAAFDKVRAFGFLLRHLFTKKSVNSRSDFYVKWELSRVFLSLLELVSWPLVFGAYADKNLKYLVWFLHFTDLLGLLDVYVRLHVAFYNKKGIYVTHPLATSLHYLRTAFAVDTLTNAARFHSFYIHTNLRHVSLTIRIVHVALRSLSLYRVLGFVSFVNDLRRFSFLLEILKYFVFIFLGVHYYANLYAYYFLVEGKPFIVRVTPEKISPEGGYTNSQIYLYILQVTVLFVLDVTFYFNTYTVLSVVETLIIYLFGWFGEVFWYSITTVTALSQNIDFATHQFYMTSFIKFLSQEKADDAISNEALEQIQYEWDRHREQNIKSILSRFPQILHEDLLLGQYKVTLGAVGCLSQANETFYRRLTKYITEVHLKKGGVVIFSQQVQKSIFFIHKGECTVADSSVVLCRGSIMGDIQRRGIMKSTITAKSHVDLLEIPSEDFFLIMVDFYYTKVAFDSEVANLDDYIRSNFVNVQKETLADDSHAKNEDEEESRFETVQTTIETEEIIHLTRRKLINPKSPRGRALRVFFFGVSSISILFTPVFIGFRRMPPALTAVMYFFDLLWLAKIIIRLKTAYVDEKTGYVVTDKKVILRSYLFSWIGLIPDVVSVIPFELVPLAYFSITRSYEDCYMVPPFFVLRLLRILHVFNYISIQRHNLGENLALRLLAIFYMTAVFINFTMTVNLYLYRPATHKYENSTCFAYWDADDGKEFQMAYLCTISSIAGAKTTSCIPRSSLQRTARLVEECLNILSKTVIVSQALVVLRMISHGKTGQTQELMHLEAYLSARDLSPWLFQRTRKYFCFLMSTYKEGAMPTLLKKLPPYIRINLMEDLYVSHLSRCYVFQRLSPIFLKQLAARLERNIFFPGDFIVSAGDVDHNMYFIHKGQVNRTEANRIYPALDVIQEVLGEGDSFGTLQGIFLNYPHGSTYRAKILTEILVLGFNNWKDLRIAFPEMAGEILAKAKAAL